MATIQQVVGKVVAAAADKSVYSACVFLSERLVVRATNPFKYSRRATRHTSIVTVGQPNYREREFIKSCKRAGEPFPVRKVQLRAWPKRRK